MKFKFYKRKEYADYIKLPSEFEIRDELTMLHNNNLFKSECVDIEILPLRYFESYKIENCLKNFCDKTIIESENGTIISLHTILFPTNNVIGMNTNDITDGSFVLDESYLGYLDKAIRYIKMHDDSVYFDFNTDNEIIEFCKNPYNGIETTQEFYKCFKNELEVLYKNMSKYYDYFRYAEVVVKESNV